MNIPMEDLRDSDLTTTMVRGLFPRVKTIGIEDQDDLDDLDSWNTALAVVPIARLLTGRGLAPLMRSVGSLRLAYARAVKGTVWERTPTCAIFLHAGEDGGGLIVLAPETSPICHEDAARLVERLGDGFSEVSPAHRDPMWAKANLVSWLMRLALTDVADAPARCRAEMSRLAQATLPGPVPSNIDEDIWTVVALPPVDLDEGMDLHIRTDCCRLLFSAYGVLSSPVPADVVRELWRAVRLVSIATGRQAGLTVGPQVPRKPLNIWVSAPREPGDRLSVSEAMRIICSSRYDPFAIAWSRHHSPEGFLPLVEEWCARLAAGDDRP